MTYKTTNHYTGIRLSL
jgi:GPH family glycoside/pentoside/hexuronide:cation symporter